MNACAVLSMCRRNWSTNPFRADSSIGNWSIRRRNVYTDSIARQFINSLKWSYWFSNLGSEMHLLFSSNYWWCKKFKFMLIYCWRSRLYRSNYPQQKFRKKNSQFRHKSSGMFALNLLQTDFLLLCPQMSVSIDGRRDAHHRTVDVDHADRPHRLHSELNHCLELLLKIWKIQMMKNENEV